MKKLIISFLVQIVICVSAFCGDYLKMPRRYFEIGVKAPVGISNNAIGVADLLKKNLVIDLEKLADDLPKDGLIFDMNTAPDFSMNLNLSNGFRFGLKLGIDGYSKVDFSKSLIDFLCKGNDLNETLNFDGGVNADIFAHLDLSFGRDINQLHVEFTPSLFVPVAHIETTSATAYLKNAPDGKIEALAQANLMAYTCFNTRPIFDKDCKDSVFANVASGCGFDISASVEQKVLESLVAGAYLRLPIVPGTLGYSTGMNCKVGFEAKSVVALVSKEENASSFTSEMSDISYGNEPYVINRPMRFGIQCAWRPFGSWCSFNGLLGLGLNEPFSKYGKTTCFLEYDFGCDMLLFHVLGFNLSSNYYNKVFTQQLGLVINLRILEIDVGVSVQGSDFARSFCASGIGAYAAVYIGF